MSSLFRKEKGRKELEDGLVLQCYGPLVVYRSIRGESKFRSRSYGRSFGVSTRVAANIASEIS